MITAGSRTARNAADGEYDLGVDVGTTFIAAAVCPEGAPRPEVVPLDARGRQVPAVLLLEPDGGLLVGVEAEDRAPDAPERVVREFKRRLGDETPIVVAGRSLAADAVAAEAARWAVDRVAELRGRAARRVVVTHPAGWGSYRRRVYVDALAGVGLRDVVLVSEPEAAAAAHAVRGRVGPGRAVAVYDLGGGTFDATVVTGRADGYGLPCRGQGLETLGGIDFDEALFWHVCGELGGAVAALDRTDRTASRAVTALRRSCVAAKETLSWDTEAVIDVDLPTVSTAVRVTRGEFEDLIEPALRRTLDVLGQVLDDAHVPPERLDSVLLVGGSARIPLVARLVAAEFGAVVVDPDPTTAVARGAALTAARGTAATTAPAGGLPATASSAPRPSPRPRTPPGLGGAVAIAPAPVAAPPPVATPAPVAANAEALGPGVPTAVRAVPAEERDDPPTAPLHLADLPPVPARPPVRAVVEDDERDAAPGSNRRALALAAGAGLLLAAVAVFAATVPIVPAGFGTGTAPPAAPSSAIPAPATVPGALGVVPASDASVAPAAVGPAVVDGSGVADGLAVADGSTADAPTTVPAGSAGAAAVVPSGTSVGVSAGPSSAGTGAGGPAAEARRVTSTAAPRAVPGTVSDAAPSPSSGGTGTPSPTGTAPVVDTGSTPRSDTDPADPSPGDGTAPSDAPASPAPSADPASGTTSPATGTGPAAG